MPEVHAKLSASGSHKWINCPVSLCLEEQFPNEESVFAAEGTFCHSICEYKVLRRLNRRAVRPQSEEFESEELEQISDVYADFVIGVAEDMKNRLGSCMAMVEERLDYGHVAPGGFGTGDFIAVGPGEIHVCDFKTGRGVWVSPVWNSQFLLYAAGAVAAYDYLFDIRKISMSVIQPRLENIETFTITRQELDDWCDQIRPVAKLALEGGGGEQRPGEWCRFCRAKQVCRARADEALSLAREEFLDLDAGPLSDGTIEETDATAPYQPNTDAVTFKSPALISQAEIEEILPTLNRIADWITAVFAYVSSEAINHGVSWKGYKVVEGRSKRVFTDPKAVANAAVQAGYDDIYKQELISLTEFEKLMGKKTFKEILGGFVVKPPGKLALVPDSDPRPAVDLAAGAEAEFESLD